MGTRVIRSIRLDARTSTELDRYTANRGEIFYDADENTLRIYDGKQRSGVPLLKADLSNITGGGGSGTGNVDFGTKTIVAAGFLGNLTGTVTGTVSSLANHTLNSLSDVNTLGATNGQVLFYTGSTWEATTLTSSFNGGNVGGITTFVNTTDSTTTANGSLVTSGGLGVAKNVRLGGSLFVTDKFTVSGTTGNTTVSGVLQANSTIDIRSNNSLRMYDSDNTQFVGLKSPANVTTNITFTLPGFDGTVGQVLSTNGLGELNWITPAGGGVGGTTPPGGSNTQVQFNNAGTFAGDSDFTFNVLTNTLSVPTITATTITATTVNSNIVGNLTGNVLGDVTGNVLGDITGNVLGNVTGNVNSTGASSFSNVTVSGGSVNNTPIGSTTRSTGAFTTVSANTSVTVSGSADSASPSTGAVTISGGLGVALNANFGSNITVNNNINASGTINASTVTASTDPVQPNDLTNKRYVDKKSIALAVALG